MIFGVGFFFFYRTSRERDFGLNRLGVIHTLFRDAKNFSPIISIFIERFG